jgi:hypothetical protein
MHSTPKWILLCFVLVLHLLVQAQDKVPLFDFGSSIRMSVTAYEITGQDNRQEPFSFFLHGSPRVSIKGFDIPVHFIFSNHHKSLQQPFNRFGISPKYKWAKVLLGYNTLSLSKYTFSSRQFLGAGVDLQPGNLRVAAFAGRLQAAVREDSLASTEPGSFLSNDRIPRFERRAIGGRIGFGKPQSYFDFVGIKAYDVFDNRMFNDTITPRPQENTAVGIQSQLKLSKFLQLRMDLATSVFTRDTTSDDYELDKSVAWIGNILQPKTSTQVLFAAEVGLGYKKPTWGIQLNYKRIDPDYKSMGIYYLQTDISQWTVAPQFSLLRKTLRVRGSIGIQKDNLYNTRVATSKRGIRSANVQWVPNSFFQLGAFMSNFGLTQTPGLKAITDSTRISQINNSFGLTPSFLWKSAAWQHQVIATVNFNTLSFNKSLINPVDDVRTTQFNGSYTLSPATGTGISLGGLLTRLISNLGAIKSVNTGFGGTLGYADSKGKWNASGQAQYFINKLDEADNGNSFVLSTDIQYQLQKSIQFFLTGQWIDNNTGVVETSFTERQFTTGLQVQF